MIKLLKEKVLGIALKVNHILKPAAELPGWCLSKTRKYKCLHVMSKCIPQIYTLETWPKLAFEDMFSLGHDYSDLMGGLMALLKGLVEGVCSFISLPYLV